MHLQIWIPSTDRKYGHHNMEYNTCGVAIATSSQILHRQLYVSTVCVGNQRKSIIFKVMVMYEHGDSTGSTVYHSGTYITRTSPDLSVDI